MSGEMTTSHELAYRLLALPETTVYVEDPGGGFATEVDGAYVTNGYVCITQGSLFIELKGDDDD